MELNTKNAENLKKMYNLTMHREEEQDIKIFQEHGFYIDPTPLLVSPPYGQTPADPEVIQRYARLTVEGIPEDADAVLIGGLTDLMIYIYNIIKEKRPEIEIYIAITRKEEDGRDYKVIGLRRVI